MFSAIEKIAKLDDWTFSQDRASSHQSYLMQDFCKIKLKCSFIRAEEWTPSSTDVNLLNYFCWEFVKSKFYEEGSGKPFLSEAELEKKIKSVWNICANNLIPTRKTIKRFVQ